MESTLVPIKWAQRKTLIYLTLEARDVSEQGRVVDVTPEGHIHFEGTSKTTGTHYRLDLDLFGEVETEGCKWKATDLSIALSIPKKNKEEEYWPRLIKEKGKLPWIQVDWSKWVDEDEEDSHPQGAMNFDDFDDLPDSDDEDEEPANLDDLDDEQEAVQPAEESKD